MPWSWLSQRSCVWLSSLTLWIKPSPSPWRVVGSWNYCRVVKTWVALESYSATEWEFFQVLLDAVLPFLRLIWEEESCYNGLANIACQLNWDTLQRRHREGVAKLNILEHATVAMGQSLTEFWLLFRFFFCFFPWQRGCPGKKQLCSKVCVRSWLEKGLFVPSVLLSQEINLSPDWIGREGQLFEGTLIALFFHSALKNYSFD